MLESYPPLALSPMDDAHKRALVVAYYLSRFDKKGFQALGFQTWNDAYLGISLKLGVPSATIKHMRDSFDPYCSPVRKGWYQRPVLRSRVQVMEAYADLSGDTLYEIAWDILQSNADSAEVYISLKHDYILALVRSLNTIPALEFTVDPADHLAVTKRSIETVSVYWSASV